MRLTKTQWILIAAAILLAAGVFFFMYRFGPPPLPPFLDASSGPETDGVQFVRDRNPEVQPAARPVPPPTDFVAGPVDSSALAGTWSTEPNTEYPSDSNIRHTVATVKECQRRCELTGDCVGITQHKFDGWLTRSCWLKSSMPPNARIRNLDMESMRLMQRS